MDGIQHGYRVVVPRQATGDRNPDAHEANLFDLNAKYADVTDMRNVIDHITHLSEHRETDSGANGFIANL